MICLYMLLLIFSVDIDYPDSPAAWPLGPSITPRRGYGQWNNYDDFHRALDFHGSVGDPVIPPYSSDHCWVLKVSDQTPDSLPYVEGSVLIGTGPYAVYGWHYAHIDVHPDNWEFIEGDPLGRDIVSALVPLQSQGSHVHFSWLGIDSYEDPFIQPGYFNPIDYLLRYRGPYNVAAFSPTDDGPFGAFASITGIIFAIEGVQNEIPRPQTRVREVIDIIVRPYTYYYDNPANDLCIVRLVNWRLVWQNPSTLEYQPYNTSFLGRWRTLYDFSGYIYDDNDFETPLPEIPKVFFGGENHWSNNICLTNTCETPRDDASFPGVETVWINAYDRQADFDEREYCRGGWDTRLASGFAFDGDPAYVD